MPWDRREARSRTRCRDENVDPCGDRPHPVRVSPGDSVPPPSSAGRPHLTGAHQSHQERFSVDDHAKAPERTNIVWRAHIEIDKCVPLWYGRK